MDLDFFVKPLEDVKEEKAAKPFSVWNFVSNVGMGKEYIFSEEKAKDYIPYLINRSFSSFIDTVLYAQDMNENWHIDKDLQYDYMYHSIRKKWRGKTLWLKRKDDKNIEALMEFYGYSRQRAREVLNLHNESELKLIVNSLKKGGKGVEKNTK